MNMQLMMARARMNHTAAPILGYVATVLADSPVLFHMLDETSGTSALNQGSLASANGTYTGGHTKGVSTGLSGIPNCVRLNGSTGYIATPSITPMTSSPTMSIEIWVRTTGTPSQNLYPRITDIANNLSIGGNGNNPVLIVNGSAHLSQPTVLSVGATKLTQLVFTAGPTGEIAYVNGVAVASNSTVYPSANPSGPCYIGRYSGGTYYWFGDVAAHSLYKTQLSAARVLAHWNAGK